MYDFAVVHQFSLQLSAYMKNNIMIWNWKQSHFSHEPTTVETSKLDTPTAVFLSLFSQDMIH